MGGAVRAVAKVATSVINQVKFGPLTFNPWSFVIKLAITLAIQYAFQAVSGRKNQHYQVQLLVKKMNQGK